VTYRELNNIPAHWGTAVNVQRWSSVIWARTAPRAWPLPRSLHGENVFYGEYLKNAQGEDVVAGIRTPSPSTRPRKRDKTLPRSKRRCPPV